MEDGGPRCFDQVRVAVGVASQFADAAERPAGRDRDPERATEFLAGVDQARGQAASDGIRASRRSPAVVNTRPAARTAFPGSFATSPEARPAPTATTTARGT